MLNRSLLIVRFKQPFLDWAVSLDDSGLVPELGDETAYLVPEFDDEKEAERILKRVYEEVFERELTSWDTQESRWPKPRTLALFREWFDIQLHSMVEDLGDDALEDDGVGDYSLIFVKAHRYIR